MWTHSIKDAMNESNMELQNSWRCIAALLSQQHFGLENNGEESKVQKVKKKDFMLKVCFLHVQQMLCSEAIIQILDIWQVIVKAYFHSDFCQSARLHSDAERGCEGVFARPGYRKPPSRPAQLSGPVPHSPTPSGVGCCLSQHPPPTTPRPARTETCKHLPWDLFLTLSLVLYKLCHFILHRDTDSFTPASFIHPGPIQTVKSRNWLVDYEPLMSRQLRGPIEDRPCP